MCPEGPITAPEGYIGYIFKNVAVAFIVLQTLFVGLRLLARRVNGTPMGADDVLVPLSLVFNYALCGISIGKASDLSLYIVLLWTRYGRCRRCGSAYSLELRPQTDCAGYVRKAPDSLYGCSILEHHLRKMCNSVFVSEDLHQQVPPPSNLHRRRNPSRLRYCQHNRDLQRL
jgi:hypothetical protein